MDIFKAAEANDIEAVKLLIKNGANLNNRPELPLITAIELNNFDMVKLLVENGANVHLWDNYDRPPVHVACDNKNLQILKFLVENGADIDTQQEESDDYLIHVAADKGSCEIAEFILDEFDKLNVHRYSIINVTNNDGETPLHRAAAGDDNNPMIEWLIKNGANINRKDDYGNTPIQEAEEWDNFKNVEILKKHGAT